MALKFYTLVERRASHERLRSATFLTLWCIRLNHRMKRWSRWLFIIVALLALLLLFLLRKGGSETSASIELRLIGFTNAPNSSTRFALISITNTDSVPIRWRGNSVEVEGNQNALAPIVNPAFPWFSATPLKPRESMTVAVGEPNEGDKWRLTVLLTRYSLKERLREFCVKHSLPFLRGAPPVPQSKNSEWVSRKQR